MLEPVYGLKVRSRPYVCKCCGHSESISTNHSGECAAYCGGCSWKPSAYPIAMTWAGRAYRLFTYAGPPVTHDEVNPHAWPIVTKQNSGGRWHAWAGREDGTLAALATGGHMTEADARAAVERARDGD